MRSAPDLARVKRVAVNSHWKYQKDFMIAYVGVIGEQEGLDLLVQAMKILVLDSRNLSVHLVVVGDGLT